MLDREQFGLPQPVGEQLPPAPDVLLPTPEQAPNAQSHLGSEQWKFLERYVVVGTDTRIPDSRDYISAVSHMDQISEQSESSSESGRVAVIAATLGAMTRSSETRESAASLTRQMHEDMGIPGGHTDILWKMQDEYRQKPTPAGIGTTLRSGLDYLKGREEGHGEDVSLARIAYLLSAFSATQDRGLREAIYRDIKSNVIQ